MINLIMLAAVQFLIAANQPDCHYAVGEMAELTVRVVDEAGADLKAGKVQAWADNFGAKTIVGSKEFDLAKENPFKVKATRKSPGFVKWTFKYEEDVKVFGVGHGTDAIRPGTPEPADFDKFWAEATLKYNREIPEKPEITFDETISDSVWDVWRVRVKAPEGRYVYGFIAKEKALKDKKLPGRVEISAAGYGKWSQAPTKVAGAITLKLTVYPFEPDVNLGKQAEYDALNQSAKAKWGVGSYAPGGICEGREKSFFYPVILANNRVIEWFARRKDVDSKNFVYRGTSQGGGLGLAAMAFSKRFTSGAVFVPAITDVLAKNKDGEQSGWPKFVENQRAEGKEATERNAPYFCGVNFAKRVKNPIRFTVGLADTTCPPHCVYAAFNVCGAKEKVIQDMVGGGHQVEDKYYLMDKAW